MMVDNSWFLSPIICIDDRLIIVNTSLGDGLWLEKCGGVRVIAHTMKPEADNQHLTNLKDQLLDS